jgi:hypothetical protein
MPLPDAVPSDYRIVDRRFADDDLDVVFGALRDELIRPVPGPTEVRHLAQMSFARRDTFEAQPASFGRSRRALALVACAVSTVLYGGLSAAGALPNPAEVQDHVTHWFGGDEAGTDAPSPTTNAVVPGRSDADALPPPASPLRQASDPSRQPAPGDSASENREAVTPEQSHRDDAPGHGAPDPGHGGTPPGQTDPPPGHDAGPANNANPDPPGQAITTPADGTTPPGPGDTPPGQPVAPGRNGTTPVTDAHSDDATQPEQAATTDGHGNDK